MFSTPPPAKLDSTTSEAYGRYQKNPYHQRLPKPPRVLKNRYLDQTRHRVRRSNDEYGQFWDQPELESSGERTFPPAGLTSQESNRSPFSLNRALTNRKGAESAAFWNDPWQNHDESMTGFNSPPPSERRDRKNVNIETLHPLTPEPGRAPVPYREPSPHREPAPYREPAPHREQAPYREPEPYRPALYKEPPAPLPPITRNHVPMENRRSEPGSGSDDLEKFIERYKLHVGIENLGLGTSVHAPDIRYIDLRLHLNDNSSLTIKAVPFSFH